MKQCRKCGVEKPADQFSPYKKNADGLHSYCKPCRSQNYQYSNRGYLARNPDKAAEYRRKANYGITPEEFRAMLADQQGNCLICGETMVKPYVDHDHSTGKVRGLLCRACNLGLGLFRDNQKYLLSAIYYLGERV